MLSETCGDLFREFHNGDDPDINFLQGFIYGQAEKIYLGVCPAAMFHTDWQHVTVMAEVIAKHFVLEARTLKYYDPVQGPRVEIWIINPFYIEMYNTLSYLEIGGTMWHTIRGLLCGIPVDRIDACYSERYRRESDHTSEAN